MRYIGVLFACMLSTLCQAGTLISGDVAINQEDCFRGDFEDYSIWLEVVKKRNAHRSLDDQKLVLESFQSAFPQSDFNRYQQEVICRTFDYDVDGVRVSGFVLAPAAPGKYPAIIYNRGGNGAFGAVTMTTLLSSAFPISENGFVVIGSQYRGHQGKKPEHPDEFGGADVIDVAKLVEFLPSIQSVDPTKIGMLGSSRGGMQSFLTLPYVNHLRALVLRAPMTDLLADLTFRPEMEKIYTHRIVGYSEATKAALLNQRSINQNIEKVPADLPVLILHGEKDEQVSVERSIKLAELLEAAAKPHKLVIYPNDNHSISKHKAQALQETIAWFKHYLTDEANHDINFDSNIQEQSTPEVGEQQ